MLLRQVYDTAGRLLESFLGKSLAVVVSHCLPGSLGFEVSFSCDGRVLQSWYQHPMTNQQHQRTEVKLR